MRILVVAATAAEIGPFMAAAGVSAENGDVVPVRYHGHDLIVCITGAGMTLTAFSMGMLCREKFDLAVNAGICGSFGKFQPGEVVRVTEDCFADLGAEDADEFLPLDSLGLGNTTVIIQKRYSNAYIESLPLAKGITVNKVHGREESIASVKQRLNPDVESMEGAAFILAANKCGWPAAQIRAVSNSVERRNRGAWKLNEAISALNKSITELLKQA